MFRLIDRISDLLATLAAWMFFAVGGGVPQPSARQREAACAGRHRIIPPMARQPGHSRVATCSA